MSQPNLAPSSLFRLAFVLSAGVVALPAAEPLDEDARLARVIVELVARNDQRLAELARYTSTRRYVVENKRFGQNAAVEVLERYEQPGRKEFEIRSEEGSSYVRNIVRKMLDAELESSEDAHRARTQITPEHYTFEWLEETELDGRRTYVIQVHPREKKSFLIRGRIWIDAGEMAIVRMEGSPAKKPSFWVGETTFVRVYRKHGTFWLPASMETTSSVLLAGKSSLSVEYYDYEIDAPSRLGTSFDVTQDAQVNLVDHVVGPE